MKRLLALIVLILAPPVFAQQTLYLQVVNQAGGPIAGATVAVVETNGPEIGTTTTDAQGSAELDGVNPSRRYEARVMAVNYQPFQGQLSYPDVGRTANDPEIITLVRAVPPDPPRPTRANHTITLDEAFFGSTLGAGWEHQASGSSWLRRCQLFPAGTQAMPGGWVMRGGSFLWAFFTSASCTFTLFDGSTLNDPWTFVSYTVVDGRDSGLCPQDYTVNVMATPPAGSTTIPLVVNLTAGWSDCHAAVTEITVNGPENADPLEAFVP